MAAKKRTRKARVPAPLARRAPPTVYAPADASDDDGHVYVRVPLAPHVVTALREHAENGSRLFELITGAEADTAVIFEQIAKTAAALERDVAKLRARAARRRRRR